MDDGLDYISTVYDIEHFARASRKRRIKRLMIKLGLVAVLVASVIIFYLVS